MGVGELLSLSSPHAEAIASIPEWSATVVARARCGGNSSKGERGLQAAFYPLTQEYAQA